MKNSETLSMNESKKPPNFVDLFVSRAIAPSQPSIIPVINTNIEKNKRFWNKTKEMKQRSEKQNIRKVAKFGVMPILTKPLAIILTKGLNMYLIRNLEGMV